MNAEALKCTFCNKDAGSSDTKSSRHSFCELRLLIHNSLNSQCVVFLAATTRRSKNSDIVTTSAVPRNWNKDRFLLRFISKLLHGTIIVITVSYKKNVFFFFFLLCGRFSQAAA